MKPALKLLVVLLLIAAGAYAVAHELVSPVVESCLLSQANITGPPSLFSCENFGFVLPALSAVVVILAYAQLVVFAPPDERRVEE